MKWLFAFLTSGMIDLVCACAFAAQTSDQPPLNFWPGSPSGKEVLQDDADVMGYQPGYRVILSGKMAEDGYNPSARQEIHIEKIQRISRIPR